MRDPENGGRFRGYYNILFLNFFFGGERKGGMRQTQHNTDRAACTEHLPLPQPPASGPALSRLSTQTKALSLCAHRVVTSLHRFVTPLRREGCILHVGPGLRLIRAQVRSVWTFLLMHRHKYDYERGERLEICFHGNISKGDHLQQQRRFDKDHFTARYEDKW